MLSGGEKVRLALAKIFKRKPNMLILDEPTNHMDIVGKETLESMLVDYPGTVIFVSHDRYSIVVKVPVKAISGPVGIGDVDEINLPEDSKVIPNVILSEQELKVGTATFTSISAEGGYRPAISSPSREPILTLSRPSTSRELP